MTSNINNISVFTIDLLNNYTKKIESCKDIHEYFNLVSSICIFQILVLKHLKSEFKADGASDKDAEDFVLQLKNQAEELSEEYSKYFIDLENVSKTKLDFN